MLRQHMLHAKHAKTGFGKLGERAASVQTRICVQRFEFQISMKCLGCFRRREVYSQYGVCHDLKNTINIQSSKDLWQKTWTVRLCPHLTASIQQKAVSQKQERIFIALLDQDCEEKVNIQQKNANFYPQQLSHGRYTEDR